MGVGRILCWVVQTRVAHGCARVAWGEQLPLLHPPLLTPTCPGGVANVRVLLLKLIRERLLNIPTRYSFPFRTFLPSSPLVLS